MTEFLTFQLRGMMAAWGGPVAGNQRTTDSYPTRSALLGLFAAALGISDRDYDAMRALSERFGVAICVLQAGTQMRDYHTIRYNTFNRDKLYEPEMPGVFQTEVTERYYRIGATYRVIVWGAHDFLESLQQALIYPQKTLFLGRKCCPPSAPFMPRLIEAEDVVSAFRHYDQTCPIQPPKRDPSTLLYWEEPPAGLFIGTDAELQIDRRDVPGFSEARLFLTRVEYQGRLP